MKISKYHFTFLLIQFLLVCVATTARTNITTDQYALLSLKSQIISDPFQILAKNWSVAFSVCQWTGVTCGVRHRRVVALNISNMGLSGMIPAKLGNLSFLVSLDLSKNNFHGKLPHELAHLRRLRFLNLRVNDLNGEIPSWFGSFPKLQYLYLVNNSFVGFIPPSISNISTLEELRLSFNYLQGTIPKEIENLQNLRKLVCEHDQLSGSLPFEIFNISSLEVIALLNNHLSGSLPGDMCRRLQRLIWLNLSQNKLTGKIPLTWSQCSSLQRLSLSNNSFSGGIPKEIGNLKVLESLYIGNNNLKGRIPEEIGNLTTLKTLSIWTSDLTGLLPQELGKLHNLEILHLGQNSLSGPIPAGIFNLSMLKALVISNNHLSGNLSQTLDYRLPNIQELVLATNDLGGVIPNSISNCSQLSFLELSGNRFEGYIPKSLGDLRLLKWLGLAGNNLKGDPSSPKLNFITFLKNCKFLKTIQVSYNPLNGIFPDSIGNLSSSIENIFALGCDIKGRIPNEIGNLSSIIALDLQMNQLVGSIPYTIKDLRNLQGLSVRRNKLSRVMLDNLCGLHSLSYLTLSQNQFSGLIPDCLGNVTSLRILQIDSNRFYSSIPTNLWNLNDLLVLDLSRNSLSGTIGLEFGNLKVANLIDLSMNNFSGSLPTTLGGLQYLDYLSFAHNRFQGSIPESLGGSLSLKFLDLSHNDLYGLIPATLVKLQYLKYFNVSFNNLSGEIPSEGPFRNFTRMSFISNEGLCGAPKFDVPPCPTISAKRLGAKKRRILIFIFLGMAAVLVIMVLGFIVCLRYRKKDKFLGATNSTSLLTQERISYYELLQATNHYNESNLLGTGSFGSVYRGILGDGRTVAIKVFNLLLDGAFKSFKAECEVLRNLRHRNLTKVISSCSNDDFKALVFEFMPNGSLEKWLYSYNNFLDINQRLNIMIDVASALQYLHYGYTIPVVHCDLKPSNVLLDQDMVAHVSDFGISKLLDDENSNAYTKTLATLGYLAPEYGLEGLASRKCDIYSYGIMLMEVFTRTKPNDEMFSETLTLRSWVNDSITTSLEQVIDHNLLRADEVYYTRKLECVSSILEVALNCSEESPKERCSIEDVLVALEKIKHRVLSYC